MRWIYIVVAVGAFLLPACKPSGEAASEAAEVEKKAESKHIVTLVLGSFKKEVLESDQLVMVDFWAPWCPPCLELAPIVSEIADDFAGKVKVGKVDVDVAGNKDLMDKYVGEGIPLILFFKAGKKVDEILGLVSKNELETLIKKNL